MSNRLLPEQVDQVWDAWSSGLSMTRVAAAVGVRTPLVRREIYGAGGLRPRPRTRAGRCLTLADREEISRGLATGASCAAIARGLGRPTSTVSREVARNGGRDGYRAAVADVATWRRAQRPKPLKLAENPVLAALVARQLEQFWSPEQIAGWLRREWSDRPELHVSPETIYKTLYVQGKGVLRADLATALRSGRAIRYPQGTRSSRTGNGQGQLADMVRIWDRPVEADDRTVPGHWEGDLILGTRGSAIATLVERSSRYTLLVKVDSVRTADVVPALTTHVQQLPRLLKRSLAWDRGKEMADHVQFTIATGVQIYFCDPQAPWQRGTNENTNRLLRQYFPKRTYLGDLTQDDLDLVADQLNGRPRKTLGYASPTETLAELVATTT